MILRSLFLSLTASLIMPIDSVALTQVKADQKPTTLIAQFSPSPPPPGEGQRGEPTEPPWIKDINLSTEQRERIRAIYQQAKKETTGLRQQLQQADQQMRSLLASDASAEQLRQQHRQIQQILGQLADKHFEVILAERQVLTPEQRAQLGKLIQQKLQPSGVK